jgi:ATP-dependent RNA helicase DDX35
VSSATLDATNFLEYFSSNNPEEAIIVTLEGRMFPVEVAYLQEPVSNYIRKTADTIWDINLQVLLSSLGLLSPIDCYT